MANVPIEQPYFGHRLRTIRERMGLTRQELADQSGVTFRTVLDIEKGQRTSIQEKTLFQLARGSGFSADELRGLEPIAGIDSIPEPDTTPPNGHPEPVDRQPPPAETNTVPKRSRRGFILRQGALLTVVAIVAVSVVWAVNRWPRVPETEGVPSEATSSRSTIVQNVTTNVPCAYRAYVEGEEALNRLDRDAARAAFHRAIECDSTFAMAYAMLTHPYIRPLHDERVRLIEEARRHADHCTLHERLMIEALGDMVDGDAAGARRTLERLVARFPRDAEGHRLLGHLYTGSREYGRAIAAFETAVRINPLDGMSMNRLAYMYATVGDFGRATDAADRYVQLAPREANPYDTRGDILAWSGHPTEAMASYEESLARNREFFPSLLSLGCLHIARGEYDEARSAFRRVLRVKDMGARITARLYLGFIPLRQGKLDQAIREFNRAIAADEMVGSPDQGYAATLATKAFTQAQEGDVDEAIAGFERLRRRLPFRWYYDYAELYPMVVARRDPARALALTDSLRADLKSKGYPSEDKYWQALGCVHLATGDPDGALKAFSRMEPPNPGWDYLYPKALAEFRSGHVKDATAGFETALRRFAHDRGEFAVWEVEARYYLGRCYEALDRPGDAEVMYENFLAIWKDADPVFPEIDDARTRLAAMGHVATSGKQTDSGPSDPR